MSDPDPSGDASPKREKLWNRLRALVGRSTDPSLRESLEGVIESHGAGNPEDTIKPEAKSMMLNIIAFSELRVGDVMVPRADIVAVDQAVTVRSLLDRFIEANHSRIPVFHETLDDPAGMVHIKDVLRWLNQKSAAKGKKKASGSDAAKPLALTATELSTTVKQSGLMRELLFVPPSMPAPDLLVKMQATHIHMAIVVDEYGGTDGLATIEDLVEVIVGDIADEHDDDESGMIRKANDGTYTADGRADIETLEGLLGVDFLPEERDEETDTLGGLVFSMAARVPVRGEIIKHASGIEFEVLDSDPRRIKRIRIHVPTTPPAVDDKPETPEDRSG